MSKHVAPIKVPVPCSGLKSIWMTLVLRISSPPLAYQSHKYLWPGSRNREPCRNFVFIGIFQGVIVQKIAVGHRLLSRMKGFESPFATFRWQEDAC